MDDFAQRYADAILAGLAGEDGARIRADEKETVLDLARMVAHGTERKNAPLASYIAGLYVGARGLGPGARDRALSEALNAVRALLAEADSHSGSD